MLHDNARPHTAAAKQDLIATLGWEQLDHPPYSPDLAPRDFHVFLHPKTFLGGRRFHDDNNGLQFRDTKNGALLRQVPQKWWKPCRKVVYGMYIKWRHKWFGNKFLLFFLIAHWKSLSG
jgi:hypothetical protein